MKLTPYIALLKYFITPSECIVCKQLTLTSICNNCTNALTQESHKHKRQQLTIDEIPIVIYSFNRFDGLTRKLLFMFKYQNDHVAGNALGAYFRNIFKRQYSLTDVDYLLPVPSHRLRFLVRGFNQAEILAKHLQVVTHCRLDITSIKRSKYTNPQAKSSYEERKAQMHNVFKQKKAISAKHLLIVDDVYTTGSTIKSLIECLHRYSQNNIDKISVLTLCHA